MGKTTRGIFVAVIGVALSLQASFASAAGEDEKFAKAFSGNWVTYSTDFSEAGSNCVLEFSDAKVEEAFPITPNGCIGVLNDVKGWAVIEGQLRLMGTGTEIIATLGGNQFRMSGLDEKTGDTFIIEKEAQARIIANARNSINCSYLGYGNKCAEPKEYSPPAIAKGGEASVMILMSLNARVEPRPDANVLGVLNAKSCIKVNACTQASDGLWCQAKFGEKAGWFKKQAVRQGKWPVLTFVTGCE